MRQMSKWYIVPFSFVWVNRNAALLRGMMHWHMRSDQSAQNQFLKVFLLNLSCSGNFRSFPKVIFGLSKNAQNQFSLLEIFGYVRKTFSDFPKMTVKANVVLFIFVLFQNWFSEFPKNFSKGRNRFCVFSDLSESDFRTFPKTSRTMFLLLEIFGFRNVRKIFSWLCCWCWAGIFRHVRKSFGISENHNYCA